MTTAPLALRFARRELRAGLRGFRIFLACLILGIAAIAAIGSLAAAVEAGLRADARLILGGDAEIRLVHREADSEQLAYLQDAGTVSRTVEMRAMARPADPARPSAAAGERRSRMLVELKAVDAAYPLYGAVRLAPAMDLAAALAPEGAAYGAAVDRTVLTRLGLSLGDRLRVGQADLVLRALIEHEPDRGAQAFSLGPRVMVGREALAATGLVQPGSLVRYYYRLRLAAGSEPGPWVEGLEARFPKAGWRVRDPEQAAPRIQRFVDRLSLFLTLVGLTSLLVGGVGVANATRNYLDSRADTIAMLKCLGAPGGLVFRIYLTQVMLLAAGGIVVGLAIGALAPLIMVALFGDSLPVAARAGFYPLPLLLAACFGVLTALAFSVWPLARAREIPGARLFRALVAPVRRWPRPVYVAGTAVALATLASLAVLTAQDRRLALWFVLSAAGVLIAFRGAAWLLARLAALAGRWGALQRGRPGLRLALANLHRPGAPTASVVLSLGLGLTVLVTVAQIEGALSREVNDRLPEAAPTFYFIDIQPDQAESFDRVVSEVPGAGMIERVPTLRGRIVRIDGVPVADAKIAPNVAWTVQNERGLTYAKTPPPGSVVTRGEWWPEDYGGPPLISFDQEVAAGMGIGIGDTLTINVLGREIEARIGNLRRIDWSTLGMNFVIIFAPGTLEGAPQTNIATARAPAATEDALLDAVGERFPNVSAIRVKDALDAVNRILERIGIALRATAGITVVAGTLVLAGAIAAGHRRRVYDSVVLKVLGATRPMVLRAYLVEYGLLGLATAVLAAILGTISAYFVLTEIMHLDWVFLPAEVLAVAAGATAITLVFGFAGIWQALGQKASPLLRNA